jgi:hypothetical protein
MMAPDDAMADQVFTDCPVPPLAPQGYDGPRWLSGWSRAGDALDGVELGHGDPAGASIYVMVFVDAGPLSDPEHVPRAGTVTVDVEGEAVVLERLADPGPDAESAVGLWGRHGLEIWARGHPIEGMRLTRVADLSSYDPDPPQPG